MLCCLTVRGCKGVDCSRAQNRGSIAAGREQTHLWSVGAAVGGVQVLAGTACEVGRAGEGRVAREAGVAARRVERVVVPAWAWRMRELEMSLPCLNGDNYRSIYSIALGFDFVASSLSSPGDAPSNDMQPQAGRCVRVLGPTVCAVCAPGGEHCMEVGKHGMREGYKAAHSCRSGCCCCAASGWAGCPQSGLLCRRCSSAPRQRSPCRCLCAPKVWNLQARAPKQPSGLHVGAKLLGRHADLISHAHAMMPVKQQSISSQQQEEEAGWQLQGCIEGDLTLSAVRKQHVRSEAGTAHQPKRSPHLCWGRPPRLSACRRQRRCR